MTAFAELDWRRIDVVGIVGNGGVATVDVGHREACRRWLQSNGYRVGTLDATEGWASGSPLVGVALEPDRIPAPRWGA